MQSSGPPASTAASTGLPLTTAPSQNVGGVPSKSAVNIIRPGQQTSYHVPRGAAAVASIAMPRPSTLATVRSGPTGSLVSIRGSTRAQSPAPQQIRTRPANSPAHAGARPITPQRSDTPRQPLNSGLEKSFSKNPVPLAQVQSRTAPLMSQSRLTAPPALSSQTGPSVQIVTQGVAQGVTLAASQATIQTPLQVGAQTTSLSQAGVQSMGSSGNKPRPLSQQSVQAGTVTTIPTNTSAVVLAAPARLASPGLIGVQTGPTRLAVATALPGTGARIVNPSGRVPQGRTVTYTTGGHQVLQAARLPGLPAGPVPVRLSPAGRVLHPVHPVLGVAPLKPAPVSVSVSAPAPTSASASASAQSSSQAPAPTSTLMATPAPTPGPAPASAPASAPAPAPAGQQATALPSLRALPPQTKMVTVAAVAGTPLRSVVAAVPAGSTPTTLAPAVSSTPASAPASSAPAPKPGITYPQTLTTVTTRPVAVTGQAVRPAPGQPSVFIQTTGHRASPGPAGDRSGGAFPIQSYYYEGPSGSFQVANVSGRTYTTGGPPYIVQATATRPVGSAPQHGGATGTTYIASDGSLLPVQVQAVQAVQAVAASQAVTPVAGAPPSQPQAESTAPQPTQVVTQVVSQPTSSVAGHLPAVQIQMVPAPVHIQMHASGAQLAAPISQAQLHHAAAGAPATVTTHPVMHGQAAPLPGHHQAAVTVTQTAVSQAVPVPIPLAVSHQVLAQTHPVSLVSHAVQAVQAVQTQAVHVQTAHATHAAQTTTLHPASTQGTAQTPTTPSKPNASPRPSILRKRDVEGSPLKAQKNLTPLLQSMGGAPNSSLSASLVVTPSHQQQQHQQQPHPSTVNPQSPASPSQPKRPDSSGPQSSGSTTISATSSRGGSPPPGATQSPPSAASITAGLHAAGLAGLAGLSTEMSPRKKPRKQQLTGNELQEHKISDEEMEFIAEDNGDDFPLDQQHQEPQQLHQQVLQQQQELQQQAALPPPPPAPREFTLKRPNISLLSSYRYSWKSRNNHFLRHSDVKPKDERRPSVNELASQRHIYQRLNGWKVHHLTAQMEDLADVESEVCQQLETLLGMMARKAEQDEDKDVNRVSELIKGNMQRSRVIADQLIEAKSTVMKIFDHKPHVSDIIHRSSGKRERIFKKREKS